MKRQFETFNFLCKCLSPDAAEKQGELLQALAGAKVCWESLAKISSRHLLCAELYRALEQKDLLSWIPEDMRHYLSALYSINGDRNRAIAARAATTIRLLNEIGVEPVLLKGIANLLSGLYPDPNTRVISDIDILIPIERYDECTNKLLASGYRRLQDPDNSGKYHHDPPLKAGEEPFAIELHHELFIEKYRPLLQAKAMMSESIPLAIGEAQARLPSAGHRIFHNIAHAQLAHELYSNGEADLRQLYDFILLKKKLNQQVDWRDIALRFSRNGFSNACESYLLSAQNFFGEQAPAEIQAGLAAKMHCHWLRLQQKHVWAMWIGQIKFAALYFCRNIKYLMKIKKLPQIWTVGFYSRNRRRMAFLCTRRW